MNITLGTLINKRFLLEEKLGEGGMAVVFKARDLRKAEHPDVMPFVALKILNPVFKMHPEALSALQSEANKVQQLSHPNIVRVYDFDRDDELDVIYMVMEYVEGKGLDALLPLHHNTSPHGKNLSSRGLTAGSRKISEWLDPAVKPRDDGIIEQLANALSYAHQNGIIHSDLKPNNIFITPSGNIKLIDFGIARLASENPAVKDYFDAGQLKAFTPAYATQEMLNNEPASPSDDIYAFGCLIYLMLTGQHPYNKHSAADALAQHLSPAPIKSLANPQWRALKRCLSLNKADRYQSIDEFMADWQAKPKLNPYIIIGLAALLACISTFTLLS